MRPSGIARFAIARFAAAIALGGVASLFSSSSVAAQSLAERIKAVPDGPVEFSFAARAGVCGDGRGLIETAAGGATSVSYSASTFGNSGDALRAAPCLPGPVRVVIDRADKLPLSVQTFVGPLNSTVTGETDLGRVGARQAADYLLSMAASTDGRAGRDALMPAVLADSANAAAALVGIARNGLLPRETRSSALAYIAWATSDMQSIPTSVTNPILAIARDETDNQSVRQQSLSALARLEHGAGIPSLIELSQEAQSSWLAKESMSTLARSGDPRALEYLRASVRRTDLRDGVLAVALRSLGQEYATTQDAALLRGRYGSLQTDATRQAVIDALANIGGAANTQWLLDLAQNGNETLVMRRRAVDAASRSGAPIGDLVRVYDTTTDPSMKQALIGIYIRSGEPAAIDKLLAILRGEQNMTVRRSAIAQLGRSEDPRVQDALKNLVLGQSPPR